MKKFCGKFITFYKSIENYSFLKFKIKKNLILVFDHFAKKKSKKFIEFSEIFLKIDTANQSRVFLYLCSDWLKFLETEKLLTNKCDHKSMQNCTV
jgi:hypothetical protein